MTRKIALATARGAAALDEDMAPLLEAFAEAGACAEPAVWDDPAVNWKKFDLTLLRSTWDYAARREEFLAWVERTRAKNPADVVRWCTDKRYLLDLAAAWVPTVPTHLILPGCQPEFPFDGDFVVKPAVGAGSMDAARYRHGERAAADEHAQRLLKAKRAVIVQPYLRGIEQRGETGLVFFGDRYSHAIRKGPMLRPGAQVAGGLFLKEEIEAREASKEEREVAERALDALPTSGGRARLWYARVDVAPGLDGRPVVLEFEAAEPSLFFAQRPGSAAAFAASILSRLE